MSDDSQKELQNLRQWIADAAAREAGEARARSRRLLQQATEDATFVGTLVDLAEREADLSLITRDDSSVVGRIAVVGRDFVAMAGRNGRTSFVPLGAIAAVRTQPGTREAVVAGERSAPSQAPLAAIAAELAVERVRVQITSGKHSVTGTLRASGDDVLVVMAEGAPSTPVYVAMTAITELAVVDLL